AILSIAIAAAYRRAALSCVLRCRQRHASVRTAACHVLCCLAGAIIYQQQQPQALANAIMARPPARPCCQSPTCQSPSAITLPPLRIGYYPAREDAVADNSVAA